MPTKNALACKSQDWYDKREKVVGTATKRATLPERSRSHAFDRSDQSKGRCWQDNQRGQSVGSFGGSGQACLFVGLGSSSSRVAALGRFDARGRQHVRNLMWRSFDRQCTMLDQ